MTDYISRISEFASTLTYDRLPMTVVNRARFVLLDTIGVIVGGAQETEIKALTEKSGSCPGQASVLGRGCRKDAQSAAFINGTAGTFLELDEGNQFCRGHPAIHVVPAILAFAEENHLSGRDLITCLVVGYEIGARIGIASKIRMSMHPHGTWGTVGAASAVGRGAGLDPARMKTLINISSSMGLATSRKTMLEGGTVRNAYAGISNTMGLLALTLESSGITGEKDGIATIYGSVVSESFDPSAMVEELGSRFEISRNYFKLHACCRYNHSALDAIAMISSKFESGRIPADEVAQVTVETYSLAAQLDDPAPCNMLAAKFSIPFAVAAYIVTGDSGVESFRESKVKHPQILSLAQKVTVTQCDELTSMMPKYRSSNVALKMKDGRTYMAQTKLNKGDFEDPYSDSDIENKYFNLVQPVWDPSRSAALHAAVMKIETIEDITDITRRLAD